MKDDRGRLIQKINDSDGIVLASPNSSFNVSGLMKIFLDRLGFIFHRPRYFEKTFTGIVVQGIYGGRKITDYFNLVGKGPGFEVVKGCCISSMEPSLFELMIFRMARTSIPLLLDESWKDYRYYRENGWFETDYYYPARLNFIKGLAGNFFDFVFRYIYGKKITGKPAWQMDGAKI